MDRWNDRRSRRAGAVSLSLLLLGCGGDSDEGSGPGEDPSPESFEVGPVFLLDGLDRATIDTPWVGDEDWAPLSFAVQPSDRLPGSSDPNVQRLPFPLQRSASGKVLVAEWRGQGEAKLRAEVLEATHDIPLAKLEVFEGLPRPPDAFGRRRVVIREPAKYEIQFDRHGFETHADLYFGFGSTAKEGDGEPDQYPRVRIEQKDGEPLVGELKKNDTVASLRVPLPPGETEHTLVVDVDQVTGTSGQTELALHGLIVQTGDGFDRVVIPDEVAQDPDAYRLRALLRKPLPRQALARGVAGESEIRRSVLVDQGTLAILLSQPRAMEITLDGATVARSNRPSALLRFDSPRAGAATLAVKSNGEPFAGEVHLLQPRASFRSLPEAVRGLEQQPPRHPLVRHVTLGRDTRRSLLLAAEADAELPVSWKPGTELELAVGVLDTGRLAGRRGEVQVQLAAVDARGDETSLGQAKVTVGTPWTPVRVPLPAAEVADGGIRIQVKPAAPDPRLLSLLLAVAEPRLIVPDAQPRPNVVFYLVDTLRADHLSAYGYERPTSPKLEEFAADGILFENAGCQAPWTKPSVASIFTGLLQSFHGAGKDATLSAQAVTLVEHLRDAGYYTAGYIANPYVHLRGLNFEQGFCEFVAIPPPMIAGDVNRDAFAFLERNRSEPFFLYLHTLDPHEPYDPPPATAGKFRQSYDGPLQPENTFAKTLRRMSDLTDDDLQFVLDLYDEEILYNDQQFGLLLDALKRHDVYEDTLIVFLADHGELFREHDGFGHGGRDLWQALLHIPFVVKLPGADRPRGVRVPERVPLTSVLPTVLSVLGLDVPTNIQGEDLTPLWSGGTLNLDVIAEVEPELRSMIRGDRKLIDDYSSEGAAQVFDLSSDPAEDRDLATSDPGGAAALRQALNDRLEADREAGIALGVGGAVQLTEAQRRQLQALGYLDDEE